VSKSRGTIVAGGITQTGIFGGSKADKNKIQGELRSALEILVKNNIELIICEYFRNILEMEWAIEVALEYGLPVGATMCMGPEASDKSDHDLSIHKNLKSKLSRYANKGDMNFWMNQKPCTGRPLSTPFCCQSTPATCNKAILN